MTMAEFFMILPQGPNCWTGLGAFRDLVLLNILSLMNKYKKNKRAMVGGLGKTTSLTLMIFYSFHIFFKGNLKNSIEVR